MKKYLKNWFVNGVSLAITGWVVPGLTTPQDWQGFAIASFLLTIISKLVKPIFDLVFLPINILTLGMLRWLRTVLSLGILIYIIDKVKISQFSFPGINLPGILIQPFEAPAVVSLILSAFFLNLSRKIIYWLFKKS